MKAVKFLLLTLAVIFLVTPMFAQDSTLVRIAQGGLSSLEVKYTWLLPIITVLWLTSEALGSIKSVQANSVYQLIISWGKAIFGK